MTNIHDERLAPAKSSADTSQAGGKADSVATKAHEKAHEAAEQVKSAATEKVQQFKARADSTKQEAAERIRRFGSAIQQTGRNLSDDELLSNFAEKASRRVDKLASYVSSANPQTMLRDTEQFARRKPTIFFGGALLLGLIAGRFLKSSRSGEHSFEGRNEAPDFASGAAGMRDDEPDYSLGAGEVRPGEATFP